MILYMQRRQLYYIILVGPQSSCFYINRVVILPLRLFLRGGADIALLFDGTQCRFRLETADGTLTPEPFPASAGVWTGEKYGVFALGGKGGARFSLPEEK